MKKRVLCVEDEADIRQMIRFSLEREGYEVIEAGDARQARTAAAERLPDLMLVDWMLPGQSGAELIRRLRADELTRGIPIIMLTARSEEDDMITGLESGADDYLVKPVSLKTLHARIRALLRRSDGHEVSRVLGLGVLVLDLDAHQLRVNGQPVHLGITEYRLLEFFLKHPGRVYSRAQLLDFIWGQNTYIEERTVDVHILRLRKSLKPHEADHYIQTVRGAGYRFSEESAIGS
ncbi:MAG TPA: phosphate regulon transcriptional regulator PhoB [Thiolinea sp.]|nr:phosphate regulon transcriptional regulator PhoB [Thiolinea sp.]